MLDAEKKLLDMGKPIIPDLKRVISIATCTAETNKTLQAIIDAINVGPPATQPAGPTYREVHTLLSQIEFGDDQAVADAAKKLQEMGKGILPHLKQSLAEDKWQAKTTDQIKLLMAAMAKLPDTQPTTQPDQPKGVAVEGVPAEITDLVALLDSKDFRILRDAQAKLLDKGAPVAPQLQKVLKEAKCSLPVQARLEKIITAVAPQRPDQVYAKPGVRPDLGRPPVPNVQPKPQATSSPG